MRAVRHLRIPPQGFRGLSALTDLSDEQFNTLYEAMRDVAPPLVNDAEFIDKVVSAFPEEQASSMVSVVEFILTLYLVRADAGYGSTDELLLSLRHGVATSEEGDSPATFDWQLLDHRLHQLLSLDDTTGVVAKAAYLAGEHGNILHSADLFTDIRPIFTTDPQQAPVGAIISHSLKLTYHEGGSVKELFLSLSNTNVQSLQVLLARAEHKAESLRGFLDSHAWPLLKED